MAQATNTALPWVAADPGVQRRVLAHDVGAMTVEVAFEEGASGAPHSHPHVQTVFVQSGSFRFVIDGVEHLVSTGDSLVIPSGAVHGCEALAPGTLIDSFVPRRDDFL